MEKMSFESGVRRPSVHDIDEKVDYVRRSKEEDEGAYETHLEEIPLFAKGEGDEDTKSQFYPGWTKDDFQRLLERLEEEDLLKGE